VDPATFSMIVDHAPPSMWPQLRAAHLYRSVPFERDRSETDWILEEAADPLVGATERIWAMRTIVEMIGSPSRQALAAITKLASDPDCRVATAAAVLVATAGDPSLLPQRLKHADPTANARMICMASQDVSYLDHDIADRVHRVLESYQASQLHDLYRCDGTRCASDEHRAQLHFQPAGDGGVVLANADITEVSCNSWEHDFDDYDIDLEEALSRP
jgi:hypothetical protein